MLRRIQFVAVDLSVITINGDYRFGVTATAESELELTINLVAILFVFKQNQKSFLFLNSLFFNMFKVLQNLEYSKS